jgi:hypothetical protein
MRNFLVLILLIQTANASELTNDSYGNVKIGMRSKEALKQIDMYASDKLSYDENYECHYLYPQKGKNGPYIMIIKDIVARFDIFEKELKIQTIKGIGIGSSKDDVLKAYPETVISPHPYISPDGEYLEVKLPTGNGIIFETDHDLINKFRLGSYPAVTYIEGCL